MEEDWVREMILQVRRNSAIGGGMPRYGNATFYLPLEWRFKIKGLSSISLELIQVDSKYIVQLVKHRVSRHELAGKM